MTVLWCKCVHQIENELEIFRFMECALKGLVDMWLDVAFLCYYGDELEDVVVGLCQGDEEWDDFIELGLNLVTHHVQYLDQDVYGELVLLTQRNIT